MDHVGEDVSVGLKAKCPSLFGTQFYICLLISFGNYLLK